MGTPVFAVPVLDRLIDDGHQIIAVVTQPDRKKGRGKAVSISPVKQVAVNHGITVLQPERIRRKEVVGQLRALQPELFITCAYGQILSQAVLDIPEYGCINVHASLLPKYRGAAPIHRAVMNGEKTTGITTMMTDRGMDTGDILLKSEVKIDENMTSGDLHDILTMTGADLISKTLAKLGEGKLKRIPQDDSMATHAPMLSKKEGIIDWHNDSNTIHNKIRALNPWPGCFTSYKGKRMRLIKSSPVECSHNEIPGSIIDVNKSSLEVACGRGTLQILEMQFENGKAMSITQCWHNIDKDAILGRKD